VGAVLVHDGGILLVRRARDPGAGEWSVPGGRVEAGEALAEAVLRELWEETGVVGVCGPLLDWVEVIDDDHHFVIFDFTVSPVGVVEPVPGDDAAEAALVPLHEVGSLQLVGGLAELLHEHGVL
jgi:8-oxo-dGTP diphosphatase